MLEIEDGDGSVFEVYVDSMGHYTLGERVGKDIFRIPKFRTLDDFLKVVKIILTELGGGECVEERDSVRYRDDGVRS